VLQTPTSEDNGRNDCTPRQVMPTCRACAWAWDSAYAALWTAEAEAPAAARSAAASARAAFACRLACSAACRAAQYAGISPCNRRRSASGWQRHRSIADGVKRLWSQLAQVAVSACLLRLCREVLCRLALPALELDAAHLFEALFML